MHVPVFHLNLDLFGFRFAHMHECISRVVAFQVRVRLLPGDMLCTRFGKTAIGTCFIAAANASLCNLLESSPRLMMSVPSTSAKHSRGQAHVSIYTRTTAIVCRKPTSVAK